jgi:predicted RNA methylase
MIKQVTVKTPKGNHAIFDCREDTCDHAMVLAICDSDVYHLRNFQPSGWAMDIGAHIGEVAIALAMDHPELKVVAVEPVPDNVEMIKQNIELNHLGERVFLVAGCVGRAILDTSICLMSRTCISSTTALSEKPLGIRAIRTP